MLLNVYANVINKNSNAREEIYLCDHIWITLNSSNGISISSNNQSKNIGISIGDTLIFNAKIGEYYGTSNGLSMKTVKMGLGDIVVIECGYPKFNNGYFAWSVYGYIRENFVLKLQKEKSDSGTAEIILGDEIVMTKLKDETKMKTKGLVGHE